jgi:hypothetical protein
MWPVKYHLLVHVKPGGSRNTTRQNKNSIVIEETKQIGRMERSVLDLKAEGICRVWGKVSEEEKFFRANNMRET